MVLEIERQMALAAQFSKRLVLVPKETANNQNPRSRCIKGNFQAKTVRMIGITETIIISGSRTNEGQQIFPRLEIVVGSRSRQVYVKSLCIFR